MIKILSEKQDLRCAMRERMRAQTAAQMAVASQKIVVRLNEIEIEWKNVALFLAQPREPNVDEFARDLLQKRMRVFAPQSRDDESYFCEIAPDWSNVFCNVQGWREAGEYSRPEATASFVNESIGAIFLPGLAFDLRGNRLGQGGGWYDRALTSVASGVLRIGVCFDFQIVENVPCQAHDQPIQMIVTEQRTIAI